MDAVVATAGTGNGDVGQRQRVGRFGVGHRTALDVTITGIEGDIIGTLDIDAGYVNGVGSAC